MMLWMIWTFEELLKDHTITHLKEHFSKSNVDGEGFTHLLLHN